MLQKKQIPAGRRRFPARASACRTSRDAGATVIGPTGTIEESIALIARIPQIDAALMDVNLAGEMSYPVAYDLVRVAACPSCF